MLIYLICVGILSLFTAPLARHLSDHIGRNHTYLIGEFGGSRRTRGF
jgi:hypothetical protein